MVLVQCTVNRSVYDTIPAIGNQPHCTGPRAVAALLNRNLQVRLPSLHPPVARVLVSSGGAYTEYELTRILRAPSETDRIGTYLLRAITKLKSYHLHTNASHRDLEPSLAFVPLATVRDTSFRGRPIRKPGYTKDLIPIVTIALRCVALRCAALRRVRALRACVCECVGPI